MMPVARIGALAAAFLLAAPAVAAANARVTRAGFHIETTTVRPSADAFVNARHPNRNFGSSRKLGADGRPHVHSYLRFRPRIGNATLKSARLGLYVRRAGSHRFAVARTSNHWRESRITSEEPADWITIYLDPKELSRSPTFPEAKASALHAGHARDAGQLRCQRDPPDAPLGRLCPCLRAALADRRGDAEER